MEQHRKRHTQLHTVQSLCVAPRIGRKKLTATQQKAIESSAANIKVLRHVYASEATALELEMRLEDLRS